MKLIREKLVTNAKAKTIVDKLGSPDDMKYEQKNAYENLKKFVKIDPKHVEALVEELRKIKKLRNRNIVSIANTLPEDRDDLKTVLHKEYSNFTTEEINLILEAVSKVGKSKSSTKSSKKSS